MILILFGVSGVGKTTIGSLLSAHLGWRFEDADNYHSAANKQKMQSGVPLTDQDRNPWLQSLNQRLLALARDGENVVLACSALKQQYRSILAADLPPAEFRFVLLDAPPDLIAKRILERNHQYMNPGLLPSQLATLEVPSDVCRISVAGPPQEAVDEIIERLHLQKK